MTVSTHKFVMNWWWYQVKALGFYAVPIFEDPTNSYPVIQVHLYSIIVFFFSTAPPRLQLPDRGPFHRYFFHWIPQHDGVRNPREHIYVYQLRQIFLVTIEEIWSGKRRGLHGLELRKRVNIWTLYYNREHLFLKEYHIHNLSLTSAMLNYCCLHVHISSVWGITPRVSSLLREIFRSREFGKGK